MYLDYSKEEYERMSDSIDNLIEYTIDKESLFSYKKNNLKINMYLESPPKQNDIYLMLELKDEKKNEIMKFSTNTSTDTNAMVYFPLNKELGIMCFLEKNKLFHVSRSLKRIQENSSEEELILSQQKSNMLNYFFDKVTICKEILLYLKNNQKEDIEKFTDNINMNNYKDYKTLLSLNPDKIKELLVANNNGFDVLNLSKEDKEILTLKTDLNYEFKKIEDSILTKKKPSFFDKFFNKNRG